MKNFFARIAVGILRIIYIPFRLKKVRNKILMISRQSDEPTLDFIMLKAALEAEASETEIVLLTRKLEGGISRKLGYCFHIVRQMHHMAASKVIVLDGYCIAASVLRHRSETRIVQIWHSSAGIKKFSCQTTGTIQGRNATLAEIMCMHKNYDYVLAPGKITGKVYEEAFNVSPEKVKLLGLPRLEYLSRKHSDVAEAIHREYPQTCHKENVLYAPTFRRGKHVSTDALIAAADTEKYNLIVKLHPLDDMPKFETGGIIVDKQFSSFDWFNVCDKIITDYSALSVEGFVAGLGVCFYVYDLDQYSEENGLNIDFNREPFAALSCREAVDVMKMISTDEFMQNQQGLFRGFIDVDVTRGSEDLAYFILGLLE